MIEMDMRFTLRAHYRDLRGGLINYGPGKAFDVAKEIPEDGVVMTNDASLQQALSGYRGGAGLVFDAAMIMPDGTERPAERDEAPPRPPARTPAEALAQKAAKDAEVVHTKAVGYQLLSVAELTEIIEGQGLAVPADATVETLVQIIEEADKGV
jgi:hypothetical protein